MPGATHIVHMPSHTFIRVGLYGQASAANRAAISLPVVDEVYPLHNLEFLVYTLRMEGRAREAMAVGSRLHAEALHRAGDCCEAGSPFERFVTTHLYALVVFQRWPALLALPPPPPEAHFYAVWYHWAVGMAHCYQSRPQEAQRSLFDLEAARARTEAAGARYRAPIFPAVVLADLARLQLRAALIAVTNGDADEEIGECGWQS
jgi:hypothetical protein